MGEEPAEMYAALDSTVPLLPADRPRYLMGVGRPIDLVEGVLRGVDLFDCVMPTRNGRNATAFTSQGLLRMRNACHQRDPRPLDEECAAPFAGNSAAAICGICLSADEMLGPILLSLHNVAFYQRLMARPACRPLCGPRIRVPLPSACSMGDVRLRLRRKRRFRAALRRESSFWPGSRLARHAVKRGQGKELHGDLVEHFLLLAADAPKRRRPERAADGAGGFLGSLPPSF